MAGIDKIYINDVNVFEKFYNWCKENTGEAKRQINANLLNYFYVDNIKEFIDWQNECNNETIKKYIKLKELLKTLNPNSLEYKKNFGYLPNDSDEWIVDNDFVKSIEDFDIVNYKHSIPITNFPTCVDIWLVNNCPIKEITNYIINKQWNGKVYDFEKSQIKQRIKFSKKELMKINKYKSKRYYLAAYPYTFHKNKLHSSENYVGEYEIYKKSLKALIRFLRKLEIPVDLKYIVINGERFDIC